MTKKLASGIALGLACVPALAEEPGFYAGFGIGEATVEDEIAGTEFRGTEAAVKLFGGYRFNEYGSLELAYLDANEFHERTPQGLDVGSEAGALQASAILQVPVGRGFEGFVRGSFFAWEAKNSVDDIGIHISQREEGTDWGYGIGAAYYPAPRFGVRAEFENAKIGGTDLEVLTVAGIYRF